MANYTFGALKAGYSERWGSMEVNTTKENLINTAADLVISHKAIYENLQAQTSVPWYVIGLIHYRESNCNLHTHLHNGDPLNARTVHEPKGYPRTSQPPFSFEYSAIDCIKKQGYDKVKDWGIERIAYTFESMNGFGYRGHGVNSPYLWASSNQYTKGKYIRDDIYDGSVVDKQLGVMPILKVILAKTTEVVAPEVEDVTISPTATPQRLTTSQMNAVSRKYWWNDLLKWLGIGGTTVTTAYQGLKTADLDSTKTLITTSQELALSIGAAGVILLFGGIIVYAIYQSKIMKDDVQEGRSIPSGEKNVS